MTDGQRLAKAISFAATKHADQTRKDGTPYIYHPMAVAELLKKCEYGINVQIAAVLHDVLEDTDATEEEVKEFGLPVYEAVKLVTRPEGIDEAEYVRKILENPIAAAVKNADKVHNLWEVVYTGNKNKVEKYAHKAEVYYENKFSEALDDAIKRAKYMSKCINLQSEDYKVLEKKGGPDYSIQEMRLYSEAAAVEDC